MAQTLKVRRVGNSLGVLLPQGLLESLQAQEGTELYVVATPDGIRLTPYDPDFAAVVEDARQFMETHRNAFHELAK